MRKEEFTVKETPFNTTNHLFFLASVSDCISSPALMHFNHKHLKLMVDPNSRVITPIRMEEDAK